MPNNNKKAKARVKGCVILKISDHIANNYICSCRTVGSSFLRPPLFFNYTTISTRSVPSIGICAQIGMPIYLN